FGAPLIEGAGKLEVLQSPTILRSMTIEPSVVFGADVSFAVPLATTLTLNATRYGNGATVSGSGILAHEGPVTIDAGADVLVGSRYATWQSVTLLDNSHLTVASRDFAPQIVHVGDNSLLDVHTGYEIPNDPLPPIFVSQPWGSHRALELFTDSVIDGAALNVYDELILFGDNAIVEAPIDFHPSARVNPQSFTLRLNGPIRYLGGTYFGAGGAIVQNGEAVVEADTTIGAGTGINRLGTYDWDGTIHDDQETVINPGVAFQLRCGQIDIGDPTNDGFDDVVTVRGGTLGVWTGDYSHDDVVLAPWRMAGTVNLIHSSGLAALWEGSPATVTGTINVTGGASTITANITQTAGSITIGSGSTLQLQGAFTHSAGTVTVATGRELILDGKATFGAANREVIDGQLTLNASTTMQGGFYAGAGTLQPRNKLIVAADTAWGVDAEFASTSTTGIKAGATLSVNADTHVPAGASFNPGGTLQNLSKGKLTLDNDAAVGVSLRNEGLLSLQGSAAAEVHVAQYTQSATGTLQVDLGDIYPDTYDVLNVDGDVTLAGTLQVSLIDLGSDPFLPAGDESFRVLTSTGSLATRFDTVLWPTLPPGLEWSIRYTHQAVFLEINEIAILLGDYNHNGVVDAADYTVWKDAFGSTTDLAADGNDNGVIDAADYTIWKDNFGQTAGSVANVSAVPEPASLVLVCLALVAIAAKRPR
ncbi:MAG: PEP-CTERM sorting domain-containing protein, partial [Planctomycetales bacterium]|nr:PEP-CTERM sorting domain-containing protein [Planctomycetales bacterium]